MRIQLSHGVHWLRSHCHGLTVHVLLLTLSGRTLHSKMRIAEACHLLEHWRGRIAGGLASLIWVQTSPLFEDQDNIPDQERRFREDIAQSHNLSDEEVFVLPQSDKIDEDEDQSNNDEQHPYSASHTDHPYKDAMEEVIVMTIYMATIRTLISFLLSLPIYPHP